MDAGASQVGWGRKEEGDRDGTSGSDGEGAMSLGPVVPFGGW